MNKRLNTKRVRNSGKRKLLGYYLGYPKCCVKSFDNVRVLDRSDKQHIALRIILKSGFSGYIPCHNCSEKILSGHYKKLTDIFDMNRRNLEIPMERNPRTPSYRVEKSIFPKINPEIKNLCNLIDKNKVNITNKIVSKKYPFINLTEDEKIYVKYFERRIIKKINLKIRYHRSILSDDRLMTKKEHSRFSRKRKLLSRSLFLERKRRKIDK